MHVCELCGFIGMGMRFCFLLFFGGYIICVYILYIHLYPFTSIYIHLYLFMSIYPLIYLSTRFSTYPSFPPSISPRLPIGAHEAHPIGYFEEQQLPAELHVSHGCTGPVIVAMGLVMLGMGDFT